jgi:hypothetical protein
VSRPALGFTQLPIQWVPTALSLGVKRPGCEANHSPPSSIKVKNELHVHSLIRLHGVVLNFTFTLYDYSKTCLIRNLHGTELLSSPEGLCSRREWDTGTYKIGKRKRRSEMRKFVTQERSILLRDECPEIYPTILKKCNVTSCLIGRFQSTCSDTQTYTVLTPLLNGSICALRKIPASFGTRNFVSNWQIPVYLQW